MAASQAAARSAASQAEARLGLTEFLLTSEDVSECGRRSLEWLAEYAGARSGACLAVDVEHNRLTPVANYGMTLSRDFAVDLDDRAHPLVMAALSDEAVTFPDRRGERRPGSPLGRVPLIAQPMFTRVGREKVPAGLLLVSPPETDRGQVAWVANVLASPLVRLGRTRFQAEGD